MLSENLVTGVLCAVAGGLALKAATTYFNRRNGNGKHNHVCKLPLAAERDLADLTAGVQDLMKRVAAIEASIPRLFRERRRDH